MKQLFLLFGLFLMWSCHAPKEIISSASSEPAKKPKNIIPMIGDLYREKGRYAGTNWVALLALVVGVLPNVIGFLKGAKVLDGEPDMWDALYVYAWFTGFFLAVAVYYGMTKLGPRKRWIAP